MRTEPQNGPKRSRGCAAYRSSQCLPKRSVIIGRSSWLSVFHAATKFVFTTATGKPLDRHNVRNQGVVTAGNNAGLHGAGSITITTHDLRRTFISHLILGLGLDPVQVARIAGHSNVSVTLNTYADEFDKALHRDDLFARIDKAGFGAT
jgi:integrase